MKATIPLELVRNVELVNWSTTSTYMTYMYEAYLTCVQYANVFFRGYSKKSNEIKIYYDVNNYYDYSDTYLRSLLRNAALGSDKGMKF